MQSHIKRLTILGLFAALSIAIYGLEILIPNPIPVPGIKLGLANIITLVVLKRFGVRDTILVVTVRLLLSALLFGNLMSLLYSVAGAILCLIAEALINKFLHGHTLYITAMVGALFHNAGQLLIALLLTSTLGVISYAPYLAIAGILTGGITGLCAHFVLRLLPKVEAQVD